MCDEIRKIRKLKSATTFDEQLNKIKDRGCIIGDEVWAKDILKQINYYRLTAYFYHIKNLMKLMPKVQHLTICIELMNLTENYVIYCSVRLKKLR